MVLSEVMSFMAIDSSRAAADGAHLRWFVVSDALRGRGLGNDLPGKAIAFCRDSGYGRVHLWTSQGLDAAAHLYRKHRLRPALEGTATRRSRAVVGQRHALAGGGQVERARGQRFRPKLL